MRFLFEVEDAIEQLPIHVDVRLAGAVPEGVLAVEAAATEDFNVASKTLIVACAWGADTSALKEVVERSELDLIALTALFNIELKEIVKN